MEYLSNYLIVHGLSSYHVAGTCILNKTKKVGVPRALLLGLTYQHLSVSSILEVSAGPQYHYGTKNWPLL